MSAYDSWLEEPYRDSADSDEYQEWCEEKELDPNGDHWDDFRQYLSDAAEDREMEWEEMRAEESRFD